jgi:hypothetical protein
MRKVKIGMNKSSKYVNLGVDCTTKEVDQYISLFKEYNDVFSWAYDDLKAYDKMIFQHIIPLREEVKSSETKNKDDESQVESSGKNQIGEVEEGRDNLSHHAFRLAFKSSDCKEKH